LEDTRLAPESDVRGARLVQSAHARLAFAVVAEAAALENPRQQRHGRDIEVLGPLDRFERRYLQADRGEELLLGDAILRHCDALRRWTHDAAASQKAQGVGRDILEL